MLHKDYNRKCSIKKNTGLWSQGAWRQDELIVRKLPIIKWLWLWLWLWLCHECPEIGTSSIDWAQLSRFYLKTETDLSLWNVVFWTINRTFDNVQKQNICAVGACLVLCSRNCPDGWLPWKFGQPCYGGRIEKELDQRGWSCLPNHQKIKILNAGRFTSREWD
jgi:hypothetical protein